jgi:hypothetical protein
MERMGVGRAGEATMVMGASTMGSGRFSIGISASGTCLITSLN